MFHHLCLQIIPSAEYYSICFIAPETDLEMLSNLSKNKQETAGLGFKPKFLNFKRD